jgi:hypothetical protein
LKFSCDFCFAMRLWGVFDVVSSWAEYCLASTEVKLLGVRMDLEVDYTSDCFISFPGFLWESPRVTPSFTQESKDLLVTAF